MPDSTAPGTDRPAQMLSSLWDKYLPLMRERMDTLDAAKAAVQAGLLSAAQRSLALDAAHKFAGSLGMFGFPEGTDAARSIEHHLLAEGPADPVRISGWVNTLHTVLKL